MKISIITVTYNAESTLERTLESVEWQTHTDIEHIIMDGASRDGTLAMAERYKDRALHDVIVKSEEDKGLYDAMNKAIAIATGEYMVFLNAGDTLHDESVIEKVANAAEGHPGVIYGDTAIVDEEGRFLHLRRLRPPHKLTWRSFRHGMLVCHQSFYVNRTIVQQYDLSYRFSADFDWCIRCMKEGERQGMRNVAMMENKQPEIFADYLSEGMTTANHKASLRERMDIMAKHYGWPATIAMHAWFVIRAFIK